MFDCPGSLMPVTMLPYLLLPEGSWYHNSGIDGCVVIVTPGGNFEPVPL